MSAVENFKSFKYSHTMSRICLDIKAATLPNNLINPASDEDFLCGTRCTHVSFISTNKFATSRAHLKLKNVSTFNSINSHELGIRKN